MWRILGLQVDINSSFCSLVDCAIRPATDDGEIGGRSRASDITNDGLSHGVEISSIICHSGYVSFVIFILLDEFTIDESKFLLRHSLSLSIFGFLSLPHCGQPHISLHLWVTLNGQHTIFLLTKKDPISAHHLVPLYSFHRSIRTQRSYQSKYIMNFNKNFGTAH